MNEVRQQSPISVLNLGAKPRNALCRLGISTIGEFLQLDVSKVSRLYGVGYGTVEILREIQKEVSYLTNDSDGSKDFKTSIADLWDMLKSRLSIRTRNGLKTLSVNSISELMDLDRETFLSIRSIGETSWNEIQQLQDRISQMKLPAFDKQLIPESTNKNIVSSFDDKEILNFVRNLLRARAHLIDDLKITNYLQLKSVKQNDVLALPGAGLIAWNKLNDSILLAEKAYGHKSSCKSYSTIEDFPLWSGQPLINADIPEKFFPNEPINNIINASRCKEALKTLNLNTIADVILTSPDIFLKLPNFGMSSLEALRLDISNYIEYQSVADKNERKTNSFTDFLLLLCLNANIPDDHVLIVNERLTGKNNSLCTLEEIAVQFGCTRERIRQIINAAFIKVNINHKNQHAIEHLRATIKDLVIASGGIINIEEAMPCIMQKMGWEKSISRYTFSEYLKYIPIGQNLDFDGYIISMQHPCRMCYSLSNKLKQIIENDNNGEISLTQLEVLANNICKVSSEVNCPKSMHHFSNEFWCEVANKLEMTFHAQKIYTNKKWLLQNGGLSKKVEAILYNAHSSLKPNEVAWEINKELGRRYSTNKIHKALIYAPESIVWGRGEFIHSNRINFSEEIIDYISVILTEKLSTTPFIASRGIFDDFRAIFQQYGIPNEYALASVINLRLEEFYVDRYRYIYSDKPDTNTSIDELIEQKLLDAGEAVRRSDLEKWLIEEIGIRETLVNCVLSRIDTIIPEKKGWLVHVDNLEISKAQLIPLCENINKELKCFSQLGVYKIMKHNQVHLAHLKIHSPKMLYGILQHFYSDKYNFPRFPHISHLGQEVSLSLSQELLNYVHKNGNVVTTGECVEYFEKKGYSAVQTRARITGLPELFEYYPRCVIHEKTLGWNSEKNRILKDILVDCYNDRISSGHLSGDLDEVFELYEEKLPSHDNEISWTGRLLASIAGQLDGVLFLGNAKRAYILLNDSCPFSDLGDLVCYLVRQHFSGGCSRAKLNQWLVDNGIVKKQLTTQMFTPPKGLVFTNYECYWEGS